MINLLSVPQAMGTEELHTIVFKDNDIQIEKIISAGYVNPRNFYYDQPYDEWLSLLQGAAVISFKRGGSVELKAGDTLCLARRDKHRIDMTSSNPPCIWLCVHKLHD